MSRARWLARADNRPPARRARKRSPPRSCRLRARSLPGKKMQAFVRVQTRNRTRVRTRTRLRLGLQLPAPSARMMLAMHGLEPAQRQVRVNLGGGNVSVAQQQLHTRSEEHTSELQSLR